MILDSNGGGQGNAGAVCFGGGEIQECQDDEDDGYDRFYIPFCEFAKGFLPLRDGRQQCCGDYCGNAAQSWEVDQCENREKHGEDP